MIFDKIKKLPHSLFYLYWFLILISINSLTPDFNNQTLFSININSFLFLSNFFRFYVPFLILTILICYYLQKKLLFQIDEIIFLIYASWQFFLFIYHGKYSEQLHGFQLLTAMISTILILNLSNQFKIKKFNLNSLKILLFLMFVYSCYYSFSLILEFIKNENMNYLYSSTTLEAETKTLEMANPRITGLARSVTILFFLAFFYKLNKLKTSKLLTFVIIIAASLIYAFQSRGSFVAIFVLILIYLFFYKEKINHKLKSFVLYIVIPIIAWHSVIEIKKYFYTEIQIKKIENLNFQESRILTSPKVGVEKDLSSGRIIIWERAIQIINNKKIIFGLGPQADRLYLSETELINDKKKYFWINNVSNLYIYSYLCGGIIGLIAILLLNIVYIKKILRAVFVFKINNLSYFGQFSLACLVFMLLRGLFENSYGVFSIDYCLIVLCYSILKDELSINNN